MGNKLLNLSEEKAKETSMVDLAFEILKATNTPLNYRDLMKRVGEIKGMSDEDVMNAIAQLYTEINIDGRFACVGENLWGLKRWYPMDKTEGAIGAGKRFVNDDVDEEDDDDEFNYDDADDFEEVEDDIDLLNEDSEDDIDEDSDEEETIDEFEDSDDDAEEEADELEESDEEDLD